jgi:hypothetical protein
MRERENNMDGVGVGDTNMSYAFVTVLDAAYGGMWVFERSLRSLDHDLDREDELARAEQVLKRLQAWRRRLPQGKGTVQPRGTPAARRRRLAGVACCTWPKDVCARSSAN